MPKHALPRPAPALPRACYAVLAVALALVTTVVVTSSAPSRAASLPKLSGVEAEPDGAPTANAFGTWRNAPVTVATDYLGGASWSSIANPAWAGQRWEGSNIHVEWAVPMLPYTGGYTLQEEAKGTYNSYFVSAALQLVAGGQGYSTIRLGWENTGTWYPWGGTKDPASYAAAWRQVVTAMRSVPGAHFTFDFNVGDTPFDPTPMWPGDSYVDYVGLDIYDQSWAVSYAPTDHAKVWSYVLTRTAGLNWMASFAAAHGKRLTLPEWGLASRCDGHGGGDDPVWIQNMHDWIQSHDVAYETVFDSDDDGCHLHALTGGAFPNAAALYKQLWGTPVTPPTPSPSPSSSAPSPSPSRSATPSVSPSPSPSVSPSPSRSASPSASPSTSTPPATGGPSSTVAISFSPSRTNAQPIINSTDTGKVYVFLTFPNGTPTQVVYALDGKWAHTESTAPWDYVGGTATTAAPWDLAAVQPGLHTIAATVTWSTGAMTTTTSSFTVGSLWVSSSAGRANPVGLAAATLPNTAYIFYKPASSITNVQLWIDGNLHTTESTSPYDYNGGTVDAANPLNTSTLTPGSHTITAIATTASGQQSQSASFTVAG